MIRAICPACRRSFEEPHSHGRRKQDARSSRPTPRPPRLPARPRPTCWSAPSRPKAHACPAQCQAGQTRQDQRQGAVGRVHRRCLDHATSTRSSSASTSDSRNRAKSRQFTSDMDIFAEVIENGERTGLLGYREDLWKKSTGMDKRLVFKLFNETLNWRATMDLMIGPQPAAHARRARPAGHVLLHQRRRPRQHGLSRALGAQVAAACPRTSRSSCWRMASRSSSACDATSSISAATIRSTTTTTSRSARSTARCSPSAASGRDE